MKIKYISTNYLENPVRQARIESIKDPTFIDFLWDNSPLIIGEVVCIFILWWC